MCVCVFRYSAVGSQTEQDSSKFEGFSVNFFVKILIKILAGLQKMKAKVSDFQKI